MAESKRDPIVGKHWLAHSALEGDESLEFVREYVSHAKHLVGDLTANLRTLNDPGMAEEITGLFLFLINLEQAMAEDGDSSFKIEIKRRKAGKPINKLARAREGHKAAGMVERAVREGVKQEAAIAEAVEKTGLSRSEIFTWLRKRRRDEQSLQAWEKKTGETFPGAKPDTGDQSA